MQVKCYDNKKVKSPYKWVIPPLTQPQNNKTTKNWPPCVGLRWPSGLKKKKKKKMTSLCVLFWSQNLFRRVLHKIWDCTQDSVVLFFYFFIFPPSSELLPVLGPLERYMMRPCYIALGRVLIWVKRWIGLRSFVKYLDGILIHRSRVTLLLKQTLYHQATTAGRLGG